jgi:hypothetical protein
MPTDSGAGRYSLISTWRRASAGRTNIAATLFAGKRERRKRRSPNDSSTVAIIAVAEAHHVAVGQVPVKVKRLEWEIGQLARKPIPFIAREDVRTVAKRFR